MADEFYKLQDKVLKEITRQIEPAFLKDTQITYDEYCEMIKQSSPQLYTDKYTNSQLPGLNEEEIGIYMRYLDVGCPHMNNKDLTKKDYINIL